MNKNNKITTVIITSDENSGITTANLFENAKLISIASAKCSPEDKYDASSGMQTAFSRLLNTTTIVGDNKLKVLFRRIGTKVEAQVLEMSESLRGIGELCRRQVGTAEYLIESIFKPQLSDSILFVRGGNYLDDSKVVSREFKNETEAIEYISIMSEIVSEINNRKLLDAEVVCTNPNGKEFTKWKIYKVTNGNITSDTGAVFDNIINLDTLNQRTGASFAEVVR